MLPASRRLLSALDDDRLVAQVRRGSAAGFEVLYDRHHRGVLAYCRHLLGSREEAEDALQQTFASAYDGLLADDRRIHLKAWLYTIARNRCLSMLRARREYAVELDEQLTDGLGPTVAQRAELRELVVDLHDLPERQRTALVLSELGDLGHSEIAAVLGCEVGNVKSLVFQARSGLIERRQARETPCAEIREQLATLRGGSLRRGPLRRHLKGCLQCSEYREEVRRQRSMLALALPVVPSLGLKESALAAAGLSASGGAGAVATGSVAGGALAAKAGIAKVAVAVLAGGAAVSGGGALVLPDPPPPRGAEVAPAREGGAEAGRPAGVAPSSQAPRDGAAPGRPARERGGAGGRGEGSQRRGDERRDVRGRGKRGPAVRGPGGGPRGSDRRASPPRVDGRGPGGGRAPDSRTGPRRRAGGNGSGDGSGGVPGSGGRAGSGGPGSGDRFAPGSPSTPDTGRVPVRPESGGAGGAVGTDEPRGPRRGSGAEDGQILLP